MNRQDTDVRPLREASVSTGSKIPVPATPLDRSNEHETRRERRSSDIAIIGMSGRFAGPANLAAFWDHHDAISCITPL
jgi:hypothetical protein